MVLDAVRNDPLNRLRQPPGPGLATALAQKRGRDPASAAIKADQVVGLPVADPEPAATDPMPAYVVPEE